MGPYARCCREFHDRIQTLIAEQQAEHHLKIDLETTRDEEKAKKAAEGEKITAEKAKRAEEEAEKIAEEAKKAAEAEVATGGAENLSTERKQEMQLQQSKHCSIKRRKTSVGGSSVFSSATAPLVATRDVTAPTSTPAATGTSTLFTCATRTFNGETLVLYDRLP